MSIPPLPLVEGNTLFIDNSTLEKYTTCGRSYEYYGLHKRQSSEERMGLTFGGLIHSLLELRYNKELSCYDDAYVDEVRKPQNEFIAREYTIEVPDDDHRTGAYASEVIRAYDLAYPEEPFELLHLADGRPAVEVPFANELGTVAYLGHPIRIMWTGRIDLIVKQHDQIFNIDHKTTSMMGPRFFDEFINDQAQHGYCWATQQSTGLTPFGFLINGIALRKTSGKGKGLEFVRQPFYIDPDRLKEWQVNTLAIIQRLMWNHEQGYYPMETKWCVGKYGRCPYLDVCTQPESGRSNILRSTTYKDVTWSPLNPTKS